jgi:hypothetical protein
MLLRRCGKDKLRLLLPRNPHFSIPTGKCLDIIDQRLHFGIGPVEVLKIGLEQRRYG